MYVLVCVFKIFSETIGPTEAKFHVEPQWDRGRNFFLNDSGHLSSYCHPLGGGGGGGLFAGLLPQMWPRSAGLLARLWKLKS